MPGKDCSHSAASAATAAGRGHSLTISTACTRSALAALDSYTGPVVLLCSTVSVAKDRTASPASGKMSWLMTMLRTSISYRASSCSRSAPNHTVPTWCQHPPSQSLHQQNLHQGPCGSMG